MTPQPNSSIKDAVIPTEVLKAIDSLVAAKMREQFPVKAFKPKHKRGGRPLSETKTWSSVNLRNINKLSEDSVISNSTKGAPIKVDSETRNNALATWNKRKRYETQLRKMLVG
jgi:hypothetical protein